MTSSLRLAGAAALCAALLLTACAKKTDQTTTSADTTSTASTTAPAAGASTAPDAGSTPVAEVSAGTSPDASATGAPTAAATTATATTATTTSGTATGGNGASAGFITLPVYPGAAESKDGELSATTNTGSVEMKVYTTKDNAKKVAEWYKGHLPASFKGGILTAGDKTVGTFADEHADGQGDQNVVVADDSNGSVTRIQLTTKHGK